MDPAALSIGQMWQYALEFTLLALTLLTVGAALGSMHPLSLAGLVTERFPGLDRRAVYTPFHFPRVSQVQ